MNVAKFPKLASNRMELVGNGNKPESKPELASKLELEPANKTGNWLASKIGKPAGKQNQKLVGKQNWKPV